MLSGGVQQRYSVGIVLRSDGDFESLALVCWFRM